MSGSALGVDIVARHTGRVAKTRRMRLKWNRAETFWLYWLTPDVRDRPQTLTQPIPGRLPYLRVLFSSYESAYIFMVGAWDARNGDVPGASTCAAVLVMLGCNLIRRSKLLQAGYPEILFIGGVPCRLRSFNKGVPV